MSTNSNDGYGLNKLARLIAKGNAINEENARTTLEPSFPYAVQPLSVPMWKKVLSNESNQPPKEASNG